MSESMSSPWIRDYFMNVAETFGAQFYNAPVSSDKKKVQLTDFLTYQENSYVWAWISDKDYKVSVRISKDAADQYKSRHSGRNLIDCRFSVVTISNYRPMFSPRPLGSNTTGNTSVAHISLEISQVKQVGIGGHLFGNPRDLELSENVKEWVLGLRQDGGGGFVSRKKTKKRHLSPPSSPPFSLYAPVSQCQATKTEHTAKPKPERPEDFKRAYTKRWRIFEVHPWKFATKFATKPAAKECLNLCPLPPHRTPSPTSRLQRQGTPSDWSPSNRGSPVAPDAVTTIAVRDGIRQHDKPMASPIMSNLLSDTEEHATVDTAITSDTRSLQPPTPAQRIRHSPSRSSPEFASVPSILLFASNHEYPEKHPTEGSPPRIPQFLDQIPPSRAQSKSLYPILIQDRPSRIYNRNSLHSRSNKAGANLEKQEGLDLTQPPAPSLPSIEVLEIGTSDPEEETDELQLTHSTARTEVGFDTQAGTKDMGEGETYADCEADQRSIDKVEAQLATQDSKTQQLSCLPSASVIQQACPNGQGTDGVSISSEGPGSQGSMHSLFSDLLEDERTVSSRTPIPVSRTGPNVQERQVLPTSRDTTQSHGKSPVSLRETRERERPALSRNQTPRV
ncbi:hypothetical protein JVT61DRAFT_7744 [Boletus reticuloceps]|uniref:Telomere replication protein EST3 n=1 Tax=Boletus reticuloceps TaxID=495285 RepID=A0A8I2YHM1_9AGAM|nr:hypothetical protein JVT61DRAFT_7744 [Boletus reticuloceps]